MFKKNFYLVFILFLILGSLISVSANSWFLAWMGFEINVLSFIPLVLSRLNFNFTEMAIKYFMTQAFASVLLVIFSLNSALNSSFYLLNFSSSLIFISLCMKMGAAPLHFWFPQITKKMKSSTMLILMTWQKIAPLFLMTSFSKLLILPFFAIASSILGAWGGINQPNFKLVLTFSSIAHGGWLILLTSASMSLLALYFLIYSFTLMFIIWSFENMKKSSAKHMNISSVNILTKLLFSTNIMSLGGLPPFVGFTAKVFSLILLVKVIPLPILFILLFSSVITLVFYLKMFFPMMPLMNLSPSFYTFNFFSFSGMSTLFSFIIILNLSFSLLILLT